MKGKWTQNGSEGCIISSAAAGSFTLCINVFLRGTTIWYLWNATINRLAHGNCLLDALIDDRQSMIDRHFYIVADTLLKDFREQWYTLASAHYTH